MAVALTLLLVGVVAYVLIAAELKRQEVADIAAMQQSDAQTFQLLQREQPGLALSEIEHYVDAVGRRPGTVFAMLVDSRGVVRLSSPDGLSSADAHVRHALALGETYAGAGSRKHDFEFVVPVALGGTRYAYAMELTAGALNSILAEVERVLWLLGLIALAGGTLLFYAVGGRSLMRSHRIALERAHLDGLTDLPNQRTFQDELQPAVAAAMRDRTPLALAVFDLDHFRFLNDHRGHAYGDELLKRVASVLRAQFAGDWAYRVGGDEFAVLLAGCDARQARTVASALSVALTQAGASATIGVSALREDQSEDTLRAEADAALQESKRRREPIGHFEDLREAVTITTAAKRDAVRRLTTEGGLTIAYQPIWDLSHGKLVGVEALMRPDRCYGLSGPAEAFDIASDARQVNELDSVCVRRALTVADRLPAGALLFVNLSPYTLTGAPDAHRWLSAAVEDAGLDPAQVVLEVTERFAGRTKPVVDSLRALRALGFKLALDDVGTGNSGLEMLSALAPDFVKLDRSIVQAAPSSVNARAVLLAVAAFATQTGAFVIAEGIEDRATLDFLGRISEFRLPPTSIVDGGQGYCLGRPAPGITQRQPECLEAALAPCAASMHADRQVALV